MIETNFMSIKINYDKFQHKKRLLPTVYYSLTRYGGYGLWILKIGIEFLNLDLFIIVKNKKTPWLKD